VLSALTLPLACIDDIPAQPAGCHRPTGGYYLFSKSPQHGSRARAKSSRNIAPVYSSRHRFQQLHPCEHFANLPASTASDGFQQFCACVSRSQRPMLHTFQSSAVLAEFSSPWRAGRDDGLPPSTRRRWPPLTATRIWRRNRGPLSHPGKSSLVSTHTLPRILFLPALTQWTVAINDDYGPNSPAAEVAPCSIRPSTKKSLHRCQCQSCT